MPLGVYLAFAVFYMVMAIATLMFVSMTSTMETSMFSRLTRRMGGFATLITALLSGALWPIWWTVEILWWTLGFLLAFIIAPFLAWVFGLGYIMYEKIVRPKSASPK